MCACVQPTVVLLLIYSYLQFTDVDVESVSHTELQPDMASIDLQ